jgi:dTDP-4-amino-4,6-dideoxygalactose transaminase
LSAGADVRIPLFAIRPAISALIPEVAERQRAVLESGTYVLGPELAEFERDFAAYIGRRHCIGVANGTEAITIALRAHGIGPGDEVVVPALSFVASAEGVVNAGAAPVFADIDPTTDCVTAATVEPLITARTRALLPVHLFGNVAPMEELNALARSRDLLVLEDAAQAAGAMYRGRHAGALGDAASFSFYPGKTLGAVGDAGAVLTDDDEVAEKLRRLRHHGASGRWMHAEIGYTSRLDDLQAAALRVFLPHLDAWIEARRRAAEGYEAAGLGDVVRLPRATPGAEPGFHLYVVRTPGRDDLAARLSALGVETRAYFTTPLHRQPSMSPWADGSARPGAERLAEEGLAIPIGQSLEPDHVVSVVDAIAAAMRGARGDDQKTSAAGGWDLRTGPRKR